jgi:hypothetical protein
LGFGVGVGREFWETGKGIWYLTLDYDDRIMIILRQMLRLHGVSLLRRFAFLLASASSKSP